jgi:hypothetical protein
VSLILFVKTYSVIIVKDLMMVWNFKRLFSQSFMIHIQYSAT